MNVIRERIAAYGRWVSEQPNLIVPLLGVPDGDDGTWWHVAIGIDARDAAAPDAAKHCIEAAAMALDMICRGQRAVIRVRPMLETQTRFDTGEFLMRGYVRFAVSSEEGEWEAADVNGLGERSDGCRWIARTLLA